MMKLTKILIFIAFFSFSQYLRADYWYSLTEAQAKELKKHFEKNPFILDYCDCCIGNDTSTVNLLKITKITIKQEQEDQLSTDDQLMYRLEVDTELIAEIKTSNGTLNLASARGDKRLQENLDDDSSEELYPISTNYTWAYYPETKQAVPVAKVVNVALSLSVSTSGQCHPFVQFPSSDAISDKEYKKWYKSKY